MPNYLANNYNIVRKDRERDKGGGPAFECDVKYKVTITPASSNPDNIIEVIKKGDSDIEITNVYNPPVNSIGTHYPNISHLLQGENRIILGDFNAYHESWYSQRSTWHYDI